MRWPRARQKRLTTSASSLMALRFEDVLQEGLILGRGIDVLCAVFERAPASPFARRCGGSESDEHSSARLAPILQVLQIEFLHLRIAIGRDQQIRQRLIVLRPLY